MKFKKDNYFGLIFFILVFICPAVIYLLITELDFKYGKWVVLILWFSLLGIIGYYNHKVFQKNYLIKDLDDKFQLASRLKSIQNDSKQKGQYDFENKRLIEEINDSIRKTNKNKE